MNKSDKLRFFLTTCTVALLAAFLFFYQSPQVTLALTPTLGPSKTPTPTATSTPPVVCNQIVVMADPVVSPTSLLSQTITSRATGGGLYQFTITVTDPANNNLGTYRPASGPSTVDVPITLQANTTHKISISVSGEVACHQGNNNFFIWAFGGTNVDTNGNPLVIVQQGATITNTPTPTPTPNIALWNGNFHHYNVNELVRYRNRIFKCLQAHTSQPNWYPPAVPALWQLVP
jgi:hypothetical protein